MTSRGTATLHVADGLAEVLACAWVADHATSIDEDGAGGERELPGGVAEYEAYIDGCRAAGIRGGTISLDGVNWFADDELLAAAPLAVWSACLDPGTEQPGLWLAHSPATGLVEAGHIDHEIFVPLDYAAAAAGTPEARQLARIQAAVRAQAAHPAPAGTPAGTTEEEGAAVEDHEDRIKRIIGGQRYDTAAAERIHELGNAARVPRSDFRWEDTALYLSPGGAWFIAGRGGPRTRWAQPAGQNAWTGGEGIQPLTAREAQDLLEQAGTAAATETLERYFGDTIADAAAPANRAVPAPAAPRAAAPPAGRPGGPAGKARR